jgi:hypothetical protein
LRRPELLALLGSWLRRPGTQNAARGALSAASPAELALAARAHGVSAPALEVLETLGPQAAGHAAAMREQARGETVRALALQPALAELADAGRRRGLRAALVKGLALDAAAYPHRGLRSASDLDLLVEQPAMAAWGEALGAMGFERFPAVDRTWHRAGRETVDLHCRSSDLAGVIDVPEELSPLRLDPAGIIDRACAVPGLELPVPCPEDHLLIAAAHGLLVHLFERLVWLLDVAVLLPLAADRTRLLELARASGAGRALHASLVLLGRLGLADVPGELAEALRPQRTGRVERGLLERLARGAGMPDRAEFLLALFSPAPRGYRGTLLRRALLPRARAVASHGVGTGAIGVLRHLERMMELAGLAARCGAAGG